MWHIALTLMGTQMWPGVGVNVKQDDCSSRPIAFKIDQVLKKTVLVSDFR